MGTPSRFLLQKGSTIFAALLIVAAVGVLASTLHILGSVHSYTYQPRAMTAQAAGTTPSTGSATTPQNQANTSSTNQSPTSSSCDSGSGSDSGSNSISGSVSKCGDDISKIQKQAQSAGTSNPTCGYKELLKACLPGCTYTLKGQGANVTITAQDPSQKVTQQDVDSKKPCTVCTEGVCKKQGDPGPSGSPANEPPSQGEINQALKDAANSVIQAPNPEMAARGLNNNYVANGGDATAVETHLGVMQEEDPNLVSNGNISGLQEQINALGSQEQTDASTGAGSGSAVPGQGGGGDTGPVATVPGGGSGSTEICPENFAPMTCPDGNPPQMQHPGCRLVCLGGGTPTTAYTPAPQNPVNPGTVPTQPQTTFNPGQPGSPGSGFSGLSGLLGSSGGSGGGGIGSGIMSFLRGFMGGSGMNGCNNGYGGYGNGYNGYNSGGYYDRYGNYIPSNGYGGYGSGYGGYGCNNGYGGYGNGYGGGNMTPPGNTMPQAPGSCNTQYMCQGQTLYYRNNQCVDQPMQYCQYGCNGNQCAQQNQNQGQGQYGYGRDGQPCMQPPMQPDPSSCTAGTWRSVSSTGNGCTTGWQCVPSGAGGSNAPTASLTCQPQVADVNSTFTLSYACQGASTAAGGGFDTQGHLFGTQAILVAEPPQGTNTATYTLSCAAVNGQTAGAQCSVQINDPKIALTVDPATVKVGATSTVGWVTSGMGSCVVSSPDIAGFTDQNAAYHSVNGVAVTPPLAYSAQIRLDCQTLSGGTRSATTSITVHQ